MVLDSVLNLLPRSLHYFFPICMELGYISLRNSRTFFYILDRFMGFASFKMSP